MNSEAGPSPLLCSPQSHLGPTHASKFSVFWFLFHGPLGLSVPSVPSAASWRDTPGLGTLRGVASAKGRLTPGGLSWSYVPCAYSVHLLCALVPGSGLIQAGSGPLLCPEEERARPLSYSWTVSRLLERLLAAPWVEPSLYQ